jgi:hypothetical protein
MNTSATFCGKLFLVSALLVAIQLTGCRGKRNQLVKAKNWDPVQEMRKAGATLSEDGWWIPREQSEPRVKFIGNMTYEDYNADGIADLKSNDEPYERHIYVSDSWRPIRDSMDLHPEKGCRDYLGKVYAYSDNAWRLSPDHSRNH